MVAWMSWIPPYIAVTSTEEVQVLTSMGANKHV